MITWQDCIIKSEPAIVASKAKMQAVIDDNFEKCVTEMHSLPIAVIGRKEKRTWLANRLFDIILAKCGDMGTLQDRRDITASLYCRIRHGIRQWVI